MADDRRGRRLPPEVNRILYVRNLPFGVSAEELYELFGKYGAVRQIRLCVPKPPPPPPPAPPTLAPTPASPCAGALREPCARPSAPASPRAPHALLWPAAPILAVPPWDCFNRRGCFHRRG